MELPPPVLQPVQATKTISTPPPPPLPPPSPSNPRHKKSKKSSKKAKEEEKYSSVFDGSKGPCLRPIGCTNNLVTFRIIFGRY